MAGRPAHLHGDEALEALQRDVLADDAVRVRLLEVILAARDQADHVVVEQALRQADAVLPEHHAPQNRRRPWAGARQQRGASPRGNGGAAVPTAVLDRRHLLDKVHELLAAERRAAAVRRRGPRLHAVGHVLCDLKPGTARRGGAKQRSRSGADAPHGRWRAGRGPPRRTRYWCSPVSGSLIWSHTL